jgi:7,8-dihydroneopterin aldolase/epimerase/oxygenase
MKAEIALEGLSFYAYHGYYEEERKSGNKFLVDIKVITDLNLTSNFDDLNNTVNYEELYRIVKSEMTKPSKLLENVGKNILDEVFKKISLLESAEVTITKFSPPIGGPCDKAKVTLRRVK